MQIINLLSDVELGRKDGRVSLKTEVNGNLPSAFVNFSSLIQIFNKKGIDVNDLVVLSGISFLFLLWVLQFVKEYFSYVLLIGMLGYLYILFLVLLELMMGSHYFVLASLLLVLTFSANFRSDRYVSTKHTILFVPEIVVPSNLCIC